MATPETTNTQPANPPARFHYVPALDGVRALAVVMVVAYHGNIPGFDAGYIGVDLFFVISGFLITTLLIKEYFSTSTLKLPSFWMRRVLRLAPAMVLTILLALALLPVRKILFDTSTETLMNTVRAVPFAATYTINFSRAFGWGGGGLLAHTWSLALEEQFYLIWPPVVYLLIRRGDPRRAILWIGLVGAALMAGARLVGALGDVRLTFLHDFPLTRADGLLLGCALAGLWSLYPKFVRRLTPTWVALVALVGIGAITALGTLNSLWMYEWGLFTTVSLGTILMAHLVAHESVLTRAFSLRPMIEVGRRSYGIYLYHWPIFISIGVATVGPKTILAVTVTLIVAWLSYALVERPFLLKKKRWTPTPVSAETTTDG